MSILFWHFLPFCPLGAPSVHSVSAGFRQISTSGSKNEQRAGSGCRLEVYRICSLRGRDAGKGGRGLRGPFAVLEEGRREGGKEAGCRKYAETGSFSLPRSAAPTAPRQREQRAQTMLGKTWRKGVQKAGSGQETAGSSRKQQAPPHVNVQRGLSVIFS